MILTKISPFRFVITVMLSATFMGTGVFADTKKQIVAPPMQWVEGHDAALGKNESTLVSQFPDKDWWQQFHDPFLADYITLALNNSPTLQAAISRVDQGRAVVGQNIANQLPSLDLSPGFTRIKTHSNLFGGGSSSSFPSLIKVLQFPFQAAYELDLFGKYRDMTRSARKQLEAVQAEQRVAQLSLEGDVSVAYLNLIRTDKLVQLQSDKVALMTRINELAQSKYNAGLLSKTELVLIERDLLDAQTDLDALQKQQAIFAHQLSVLTGQLPQAEASLKRSTIDNLVLPSETQAGIPLDLITRRPDIIQQEQLLEKSKIDVAIARKAFLPTINLSLTAGFLAGNFSNLFNWNNRYDMESISGKQPLFHGGGLHANVKLRKAMRNEQMANYKQTILTALKEVEDNLVSLQTSYKDFDNAFERLTLTKKNVAASESLFNEGLLAKMDLMQTQSEYIQYQQIQTQGKADTAIATVNLYKALGGGF